MAGYNITRSVEELLTEHESSPPSFTVHLHPDHWTLNGGSKFLYNNPIAALLDDIRAQRIPTDFLELFDAAKLPFYEGCMIVELLDYRPLKGKEPELSTPKRSRVVLSSTSETLWADICLLNQRGGGTWTDEDALQVEAKILMATTSPLCLDPDPHLTRIANSILRVSVPTTPTSLKRKAVAMEPEEDESEKARRAKIMQYMNPRTNRSTIPGYRILDVLERMKMKPTLQTTTSTSAQVMPVTTISPAQPPTVPTSYPLGLRATPAPPAHPTPAPPATGAVAMPLPTGTPARKSATPAPQMAASPSSRRAKTPEVKKAPAQSPVVSARPPSAIPTAAAIPHHMQQYQAMRNTPSPPSHAARPASAAVSARSPLPPERPLSVVQPAGGAGVHHHPQQLQHVRGKTPMPQPTPSPRVQSAQTAISQAPPQVPQSQLQSLQQQPVLPQSLPIQQQIQQSILQSGNAASMLPNIAAARRKTPQQAGPTAQQTQIPLTAAQYYQYMQQARLNQPNAGQAATQAQQALNANQALQLAQRNSPAGRTQQATPRPAINQQVMGLQQQGNFNYAALAQNHNANLRPVVHGPHTQLMQQQQFGGGAQAAASQQGSQLVQDQSHLQNAAQQYYQQQMYNYGQMGMNVQMRQAQLPPGYQWSVGSMGRGLVPNISGHPQQMQLGAGKAGMQGSS